MSAVAVRDLDRPALLGGIEELTEVANADAVSILHRAEDQIGRAIRAEATA